MTYRYLYQDRENRNREGEVKARSRADAYAILRKQGVRPYRVIGDDPWNWRPWAIAAGYAALALALAALGLVSIRQAEEIRRLQAERAWMMEVEGNRP